MSALAVESERQLLSWLDEVLDAPESERRALIRARFGDDENLVRDLERLVAAAEGADATCLAERIDVMLQPVLADLADHSVTSDEIPAALAEALAPRYTMLERIGRGGMATVYLAFDSVLGRHVAIKALRPELADGISLERFEREIAIAATIDHPRVVPVYDRGDADGLLFYVMRYVEGGSLRDLLLESPQLEIRRAIDIARDIAGALDAAHAKKIVHRDIKPANILLDEHGAHLADFGVARLIDVAGREHLTRTGIALGTALYMSPEQVSAVASVDGRSDVYALACVLYEMLAGEAPFTGPSQREIMAKHLAAAIPDLTVVRATVTRPMQRVIAIALQKSPADRFASASEFIGAFERAYLTPDEAHLPADGRPAHVTRVARDATPTGLRLRQAGLVTLGVLLLGLGAWRFSLGTSRTPLDIGLHVIFPFDASGDAPVDAAQRLREALARWTGIRVVDQFTLDGKLGAAGTTALNDASTTSKVRSLGARRFIRGRVQPEGEFLRIVATLFDIDSGQLAEVPARMRRDLSDTDSVMAAVAERLLFRNVKIDRRVETTIGTTNYEARRAYLLGHEAIRQWDLAGADSALFRATNLDPGYSHSLLWLAQVRFWREEPPSRWRDFAERAVGGRLSLREQTAALALQQWANDRVPESCETWERLAAADQHDGLRWYSAHKCRFRDDIVVPDAASPTGWSFRSSHHLALGHLERALRLTPAIYRGMRKNGFEPLRRVLKTSAGYTRPGRSLGEQGDDFSAYPMLSNDTLAFVPITLSDLGSQADAAARFRPMIARALERQRQVFRDWSVTWASNYPDNAEAWESVAVALESLGDATALGTITRARQLALNDAEQQRISGTQAWLLVKFSVPSDLKGLRRARVLVDSVLRYPDPPPEERQLLVSLAALTGRLSLAAEHARFLSDWPRSDAPAGVNAAGARLLLHAALAGSSRELGILERNADSMITAVVGESARSLVRRSVLGRAASLAFPSHVMASLYDSSLGSNVVFFAQQQWQRGDKDRVTEMLGNLKQARRSIPPANVQFDMLLPEARLIELAYGVPEAARWIDPTLAAIRQGSNQNLIDPVRAATLVGTMALRADLASRAGDRATAALWAAAVAELWADCDPVLTPIRDRMRSLTR